MEKTEHPVPTLVWKKRKCDRGLDAVHKLPFVTPHTKCLLKLLKLDCIKDYLLMEEKFIRSLEKISDDNHAMVYTSVGSEHCVSTLTFIGKAHLELGCSVLLNHRMHAIVSVLRDYTDPLITVMKLEKAPHETYPDIDYYKERGIKLSKIVIFNGPPGTGNTLIAKAVTNQTSAIFLRVVGSPFI
ncbi:PSMC1 [Lepeophtheirus salmonis]|uniref:PSMC1 n=1 Tax=Lepeophtheirus salmonis TaxID=72036 RepID=A0A7R8D2X2_LEPSM|nr:PSMC1 [Lepeophtheirus salmonis]CAF3009488.1 PSMC1 [Lepeophtheirus salmonis]